MAVGSTWVPSFLAAAPLQLPLFGACPWQGGGGGTAPGGGPEQLAGQNHTLPRRCKNNFSYEKVSLHYSQGT